MIPNEQLSSVSAPSDFLPPDDEITNRFTSLELGGVGISNPSQGLRVKVWTARYNGTAITVEAEDVAPVTVITADDVREIDLAFDQNMNFAIAYTQLVDGVEVGKFYWFDTLINSYTTTDYPGAQSLRVGMDDKRPMSAASNDVILTYVRDSNLYFRAQRDRYTIECLLREGVVGLLRRFGMNAGLRLQWEFLASPRDYTIRVPKDPEITVCATPVLDIEPIPVIHFPVTRRNPCGEC